MSFVNFYQFVSIPFSLLVLTLGVWDLLVLIPGHCLSIYFSVKPTEDTMTV